MTTPAQPKVKKLSTEEGTKRFLNCVSGLVDYWADENLAGRTFGKQGCADRLEGLAFSILTMMDGATLNFPRLALLPDPHPDDVASGDSEWDALPEEVVAQSLSNGVLHEDFVRLRATKGDTHEAANPGPNPNHKKRAHDNVSVHDDDAGDTDDPEPQTKRPKTKDADGAIHHLANTVETVTVRFADKFAKDQTVTLKVDGKLRQLHVVAPELEGPPAQTATVNHGTRVRFTNGGMSIVNRSGGSVAIGDGIVQINRMNVSTTTADATTIKSVAQVNVFAGTVEGDVKSECGNVTCDAVHGSVKSMSGAITVNGSVTHNVENMSGAIHVGANVGGQVSSISGSVTCHGNVTGSVKTTTGNIRKNK